ncbi:MAG: hypothetical protein AAB546_00505 [Patescibacteria group bacterium]
MRKLLAQTSIPLAPEGGFRGFGPLGLEGEEASTSGSVFTKVLSTTIGVMTVIAIIWFVIQFFLGAIAIIFSGGDKGKLTEARQKMTTGIIGLVVVIAAIFLIDLVGSILGIEDVLNITFMINLLGMK